MKKNNLAPVLTTQEVRTVSASAQILANLLNLLRSSIKPGVTLLELDKIAYDFILKNNAVPSFLNYHGFPNSICTSVNDTMIHGIPHEYTLKDGDLLSIDAGVYFQKFHSDAAFTVVVGNKPNAIGEKLIKAVEEALYESIACLKPGVDVQEVGKIIEFTAEKYGFFVTKEYCGHGVGKKLHDEPMILNYFEPNYSFKLKENMVIAIEPMILATTEETFKDKDGWSIKSIDKCLSAHAEHTILITKNGSKILTKI